MTASHESRSNSHDNQPLGEELQRQFDELLRSKVEGLEAFCEPDAVTLETKDAVFGQHCQDSVSIAYTIDNGEPLGIIAFTSADDANRSFCVALQRKSGKKGQLWQATSGKRYSSWGVLRKLRQNWPLTGNEVSQEEDARDPLAQLIESAFTAHPNVAPQEVFETLDQYIGALRLEAINHEDETGKRDDRKSGRISYTMQWRYHDIWADASDDSIYTESTSYSLTAYENDTLRQIDATIVIDDYLVDDVPTPLTCHIQSDVFGNITVITHYVDSESGKRIVPPELDYTRILNELVPALDELVKEKTPVVKDLHL